MNSDDRARPLRLLSGRVRETVLSVWLVFAAALAFVPGMALAAPGTVEPVVPTVRCAPTQHAGRLNLVLEPKSLAGAAAPPGSPGAHWVINPLPSGDDIQADDPDIKSAIQGWLSGPANTDPAKLHVWVLDGRNPWNLLNSGLRPALQTQFAINPAPIIAPPSAQAMSEGQKNRTLGFCYLPAKNPFHFDSLNIVISSRRYNQEQQNAPPPPATGDPNQIPLDVNLPADVHAFALLSKQDFSNTAERDKVLKAFGTVALEAWNRAEKGGVKLKTDAKESDLRLIEQTITGIYSMAHDNVPARFWLNWPAPRVLFEIAQGGKCCTLQVRDVQTVKTAGIRVDANLASLIPSSGTNAASATPANPAATSSPSPGPPTDCVGDRKSGKTNQEIRADAAAQQTEKTLTQRFQARLVELENIVPTYADIDSLRSDLSAAREIHPNIQLGISCKNPQGILFEANNRFIVIPLKITLGVGYSPEQKEFGKADFEASNLLVQRRQGQLPQETETFSYTGGNEVQKLNALWALDWAPASSRSTYGVHVTGDYLQDLDQRFGNLTGPVLRDRERGIEPSFVYTYASAQLDSQSQPAANRYGVQATTGLRYRHVDVEPSTGAVLPPLATGSLVGFFLDLTPSYHYVPQAAADRGGVGEVDVNLATHIIRGFPAGDFTFTQVLGSAQVTVYFGVNQPRDFLVRFRKGVGTSTGATPLFELFRLGGTDTLRGMEQGEFVGQKVAFEQSDAGISLLQIVEWFKRPSHELQPEKTPKPSPIDLSKIYVLGFYDRARATAAGSFSDLLLFSHAPKGYGAQAEIDNLSAGNKRFSLSVGYGFSPDSVLHRKGLVVTSTQLDF